MWEPLKGRAREEGSEEAEVVEGDPAQPWRAGAAEGGRGRLGRMPGYGYVPVRELPLGLHHRGA